MVGRVHPGDERRFGVDIEAYDRWLAWGHGLRLRRGRDSKDDSASHLDAFGVAEGDLGDQALLEASLAAVAPHGPQVVARFYERLFADNPRLRALFPDSMGPQREKLLGALIAAVQGASDPDSLVTVLQQLGRDHRKFGARPAHFATVGKALVATLQEFAGAAWTPEVAHAWVARYTFAARTMLAAAGSAEEQPPFWYGTIAAHQRYLPDVAILKLRVQQPYSFQPGQHATLVSRRVARVWQPYVIACASADDGLLEFHVRVAGAGGLGEALVADAKVGDVVRIGAPMGTQTLRPSGRCVKVFLTAGTGWAQTKSYLSSLAGRHTDRAYLVYIGRPEHIYDPELGQVLESCPWLASAFVQTTEEALRYLPPPQVPLGLVEVYASGPVGAVTARLAAAGVPGKQIIETVWP